MALLNTLAADPKKMREGVTLLFPADYHDPIRFQLAYWEIGINEAIQKLPPEERKRLQNKELSATEQIELYANAVGVGVLRGWSNMQEAVLDDEGNPQYDDEGNLQVVEVPYSEEKALEIMRNEDYLELHEAIVEAAKNRARYRQEIIARAAGN